MVFSRKLVQGLSDVEGFFNDIKYLRYLSSKASTFEEDVYRKIY